jgi:hypothetical protein
MVRLLRVSLLLLTTEIWRKERSNSGLGLMIDEASLYDRQIRLWGLEAQNRYVLLYLYFQSFPLSSRGGLKVVKRNVGEGKEEKVVQRRRKRSVREEEKEDDEEKANTPE